jgi:CHAD domain-containing protein
VTEYLLPDGMTLRAAARALIERFDVRDGVQYDIDRTYYDTFDGLLRESGLALVYEDGRLALIERATERIRAGVAAPKPTKPVFVDRLGSDALAAALTPLVEPRALLPIAEIHAHERRLDVLDAEQKTVVRMLLERPRAHRARLRVSSVRGYEPELRRVERQIERELGFARADQALLDEAAPAGTSAKVRVQLRADQRADSAAAAVLRALLAVIEANLEGTIADIDSEFLHDFRVSIRRSRSVQHELRTVFAPRELERFRAEFRWLQRATSDARDLDVYVLEFDAMREMVPDAVRGDLDPVRVALVKRRKLARRRLVRALRSEKAAALLAEWASFLDGLAELPEDDRPDAARGIGELAGERIGKVYRRMVKMGGAIDSASPPQDYHELRKQGKELRYLLELFGTPLYPPDVVRPMIKSLKALQDVLGRHQDREVQVATLRSLAEDVSSLPAGSAALMATGVLIEALTEDERAAREQFAEPFATFASRAQRKLVKGAFG